MVIIYDLIFLLISLFYLPVYLFKKKFHSGFSLRLGILPNAKSFNNPIWIHAVSVGEALAVKQLVEGLRKAYPAKKFVFSTVTPTGNKIARSIAKEGDFVTYLPLDFSLTVKGVIEKIKPSIFIIAETEIWPNLITCLHKRKIPLVVVNGRISNGSFKGYQSIRFLLKPILNKITIFCVQTERDSQRLRCLGVAQEKVKITGNMKFDIQDYVDTKEDSAQGRLKLGIGVQEKLFVAGSTHPGEEEIILRVYKKVLKDCPGLRLLIAPRHPERAKDVEKLVAREGFSGVCISKLVDSNNAIRPPQIVGGRPPMQCGGRNTQYAIRIFILDTIGQLVSYYSIADIVFVGGSLIKKGGHNILEPASLGKPVLFGPHMFNFLDIAELFLKHKAAIMVHNQEELKNQIKELLHNPAATSVLTVKAGELMAQNKGATNRNLEYIRKWL